MNMDYKAYTPTNTNIQEIFKKYTGVCEMK
jgi:hypothetical protein